MKHKIFIATVLLFTFSTLWAKQKMEGNTYTTFGNYTLTETDNVVVINNVAYKTWDLCYHKCKEKYQILCAPCNIKNCYFIVRGENFEVQYSSNNNGFGARLVDKSLRSVKTKVVMNKIDRNELINQGVLTNKVQTSDGYLGLIACFMPLLFV
ncbi:hypothetical protein SAMN06265379_11440 [Saccharicrinis carchari]|uniref:Uncharacterized protein n=1 Tax=Saccharicrinis carchari TaxID=1168039 RepID=A0A521F542_SACCC|nr:hypothetical protein [Saccharicrinis carchari]SMO91308.1 hypothetical protein SAMN06265379_11440 [Saccharicrinis carchari]